MREYIQLLKFSQLNVFLKGHKQNFSRRRGDCVATRTRAKHPCLALSLGGKTWLSVISVWLRTFIALPRRWTKLSPQFPSHQCHLGLDLHRKRKTLSPIGNKFTTCVEAYCSDFMNPLGADNSVLKLTQKAYWHKHFNLHFIKRSSKLLGPMCQATWN